MENKIIFLVSLWLTFILIRVLSNLLHDCKNYNTKKEKSKTLTFWIRKKTKLNIHHIHFGFLFFIIGLMISLFSGINKISIIFLAVGLSLIVDQIYPLLDKRKNYFSKKMLILSLIFHLVISGIIILTFFKFPY